MLYKNNAAPSLSDELFKNPTCEYRGAPFWAWNSLLTKDELCRQIDIFKEMGFGGFHMHVRTGLKNKYLSDEFMELVRACIEKAKANHMLAWLYDEDRWPSGAAGGMVTQDNKYRGRHMFFTPCFFCRLRYVSALQVFRYKIFLFRRKNIYFSFHSYPLRIHPLNHQ